MNLKGITLSEISQTETKKLYVITSMWNLKNKQIGEYNKREIDSQL